MFTRTLAAASLAIGLAGCGGGSGELGAAQWDYRVVDAAELREALSRADLIALGDTAALLSPPVLQPDGVGADGPYINPEASGDFDPGGGRTAHERLSLQDYLNRLGDDGWELVAVLPNAQPYPTSAHHEVYFRYPRPQLGSLLLKRERR